MNKRGSVSMLVGWTMPVVVVAGVFAVDAARIWLAKARLQSALDAAALSAARDMNDGNASQMIANARAVAGQMAGQTGTINVEQTGANTIKVTGSVSVSPILGGLAPVIEAFRPVVGDKLNDAVRPRVIGGEAVADRTNTGLELALVFDTTFSMALSDGTKDETGATPSRIEYAKRAALALTGILYGGRTEFQPNLYISVVPFNVAVNIGADRTGWVTGGPSYTAPYEWSGCVEARPNGYDLREDRPDPGNASSLFRRYYWPSTYDTSALSTVPKGSTATPQCTTAQDYSSNVCWGNNDWTAPRATQDANPLVRKVKSYGIDTASASGPNFMCPTVPILPLAMDRTTVENKIKAMVGTTSNPYPFGWGTVIATGLQGAWYTLSDQWRENGSFKGWGNPNPLRSDGTRLTPPSALPLPYGTPRMQKVVLLLSDGDNNWFNARHGSLLGNGGSGNSLTRPESRRTELFYNAYGVLSAANNPLGILIPNSGKDSQPNSSNLANDYTTITTNRSFSSRFSQNGATREWSVNSGVAPLKPDEKLDQITLQLCDAMKKKGIVIYAVGVGVAANDDHALLQACVSEPTAESPSQKYIRTANAAELTKAFTQIANELANLRLRQ